MFLYINLHFEFARINKSLVSCSSLSIVEGSMLVTSFLVHGIYQIFNLFVSEVETLDISLHAAFLRSFYLLVHLFDVVVVLIVTVRLRIAH